MTAEEIEFLFKSDKNDWYQDTDNNVRIWDIAKVTHFWAQIVAHKTSKGDFHFDSFVFPTFYKTIIPILNSEHIFFHEVFGATGEIINSKVKFSNCQFLDGFINPNTNIAGISVTKTLISFNEDLEFVDCNFLGEFRMGYTNFDKAFRIHNCNFHGAFTLMSCIITKTFSIHSSKFRKGVLFFTNEHFGITNIYESEFFGLSRFARTEYKDQFHLNSCIFNSKTEFFNNNYKVTCTIAFPQFYGAINISNENYVLGNFQDWIFSEKQSFIRDMSIKNSSVLKLRNIIFPSNFNFVRCDFTNVLFMESSIENVRFSMCQWNTNSRLIIRDELEQKKINRTHLLQFEDIYRQLKNNFENQKDWEHSGLAYISELTMRERRLRIEGSWGSWIIYRIYDLFGAYTQSFIRPFLWYSLFTFLIFPLYYLFFDGVKFGIYAHITKVHSLFESLEMSLSASLPLLKSELVYESFWIKSIQSIISGILLTFFILALRKRFKQ